MRDLVYALRIFRRNPGFTVVAVVTLALGMGANTAIFSVVNAVLLRPLPFPEGERLVTFLLQRPQGARALSMADLLDIRAQQQMFSRVAGYTVGRLNLSGGEQAREVRAAHVTGEFFDVIRTALLMGRTFQPGDEGVAGQPPVVLHEGLWRRLGADPNILGRAIRLNGVDNPVVGVMPASCRFPTRDVELWLLLPSTPPARRGPFFLRGLARLKPEATLEQARTQMSSITPGLRAGLPTEVQTLSYPVVPLSEAVVGEVKTFLLLLLGAVGLVLLIAMANVANLLLARSWARRGEIAVRFALGAGRGHLVRQFLAESILLALAGGLLGLAVSSWGIELVRAAGPGNVPRLAEARLDGRVLAFTAILSALSGILFGLTPAWQSASRLSEATRESGQRAAAGSRRRLGDALVIAEFALAFVLVCGAGLLVRSLLLLEAESPGFQPRNILTLRIAPAGPAYQQPRQIADFYRRLLDRVRAVPGVEAAAIANTLPPDLLSLSENFTVDIRPWPPGETPPIVPLPIVSPDYFRTLGVPLRGRSFSETDTGARGVAIISQTLAETYFGDRDPIGRRIKQGGPERPGLPWLEIVGVAGDVKYEGLDKQPKAVYYQPHSQIAMGSMYLAARAAVRPEALAAALRAEVRALDPEVVVSDTWTMEELLFRSVAQPRFRTVLLGAFAGLGLLLAAIGVFGVIHYSVLRRTREIGVRVALGAGPAAVTRLVVGGGLRLALAGLIIGLGVAIGLNKVLSGLLFGVGTTDPWTYAGVSILLLGAAALASYLPARRAARIDPIEALRQE